MFCLDGSKVDVSKVDGGGGGGGEHDGHRHQSGCRASGHRGGKHRCQARRFSILAKQCNEYPFLGDGKKESIYLSVIYLKCEACRQIFKPEHLVLEGQIHVLTCQGGNELADW